MRFSDNGIFRECSARENFKAEFASPFYQKTAAFVLLSCGKATGKAVFMDKIKLPVLLGGDLGAYSFASSFASLGIKSAAFARERLALTDTSSFIDLHIFPELCRAERAVPELIRFAKERLGCEPILVPCADWYMEMLENARDALSGHFRFFIPDFDIWRRVSDKSSFIKIMKKYGINYPRTEVFCRGDDSYDKRCISMTPPFVVKPSDSSEYWRHPFEGMKKVYFTETLSEVRRIAERIFASGYGGKLLVQEYISDDGKRAAASVLTTFSDGRGRVTRAVLGDVLLEERGERARGNYSAIVTRPLDGVSKKIIDMLEGIKYTGIANFDLLYKGKNAYCLELNPRQGRSFDYVRGAGINLAELLLDELDGIVHEPNFEFPSSLWRAVGRRTLSKFSEEPGLFAKAEALEREGFVITPYDGADRSIVRRIYVSLHLIRERERYKKQSDGGGICY